jgi:biotin transport system substrate-specific component
MEAILRREVVASKTISRVIGIITFIILTCLGAFVRIPLPFTPVPITLQTFFVLSSGAFLGGRLGLAAQLSYVLLGISGLPIFTGGASGLFYLFGPTGGYLFGFVLASFFVGRFIKYTKNSLLQTFALLCLGDFIILASGVIWLKVILGYPLTRLMWMGFIPFLPGDLFKVGTAAVIYCKLQLRLKEIFG